MKKGFSRFLVALVFSLLMVLGCTLAIAEEIVLTENENVVIKITEFKEDDMMGPAMSLYLENNTDKTLIYSIDKCAVNGVMNDPFWAIEVMPGSKANEDVFWLDLVGNEGSPALTKLDFTMNVTDSEDFMADPIFVQDFTLYPQGENAVILDVYTAKDGDIILFDNENATMIVTGFRNDEIFGYTADVYLFNKTDKVLMFAVDNATVNGFMCDPFWACEVRNNTAAYSSISWLQDDLNANGITEVTDIVLAIRVYDSDDWMADPIINQQFTITP